MKILITTRLIPQNPSGCTGSQLARGFKSLGHDVTVYGNFYGQWNNFVGFKEVQSQDFDLIIEMEMNDPGPKYSTLRNYYRLQDKPWLLWDFDISYNPQNNLNYAASQNFDAYLIGNKYFVDEFAKFGKPVLHLPYACDTDKFKRIPNQKRRLVGFVGSLTAERKQLMDAIARIANNSHDVECATGVFGDELVKKTNEFYLMFHHNQEAARGLVCGRPFETTACGTTLMMDRTSYEDFTEFLPEYLHNYLLVYDDETDIRRLVNEWKDKKATLDVYGEALMNYIHQNHSYRNRAKQILEFCDKEKLL